MQTRTNYSCAVNLKFDEKISRDQLSLFLKYYGEYPDKYRCLIWRILLRIPENKSEYATYANRGIHPSVIHISEKYAINDKKLLRNFQRVLSAILYWAPTFSKIDYLQKLTFPFAAIFQNNSLVCFEVILSIIVNWCTNWLHYFPAPPYNIFSMIENMLCHFNHPILDHLIKCRVTTKLLIWPVLSSFFSEVFSQCDWLRIVDHILTNHPAFLIAVATAYIICLKPNILSCSSYQDFQTGLHLMASFHVSEMLTKAYTIFETVPSDIDPKKYVSNYTPLESGVYPMFNGGSIGQFELRGSDSNEELLNHLRDNHFLKAKERNIKSLFENKVHFSEVENKTQADVSAVVNSIRKKLSDRNRTHLLLTNKNNLKYPLTNRNAHEHSLSNQNSCKDTATNRCQ